MFDWIIGFFLQILLVILLAFLCWKLLWLVLEAFGKDLAKNIDGLTRNFTPKQKILLLSVAILITLALLVGLQIL